MKSVIKKNMDGHVFSKHFGKTIMCSKYFEKNPLAPPPAAPSGRHRARRRGYFFKIFGKQTPFFKIFGKQTLFSKYWEKNPSIFS